MRINLFLVLPLVICSGFCLAQQTFPVNGVHDERPDVFAFTNARITVAPGETIHNGTLLVRDGKVVAAGQNIAIPQAAVVKDMHGQYIYPSFIDLYGFLGAPGKNDKHDKSSPLMKPSHWNPAIHPEHAAVDHLEISDKEREEWLKSGFALVNHHHRDGIMRGTSVLVGMGKGPLQEQVFIPEAALHCSFSKGSSKERYPSSLMGAIALVRQTLYDARWYANNTGAKDENLALEAINEHQKLPIIFEAGDHLSIPRAQAIAEEFGLSFIIKGNGKEYRVMRELLSSRPTLILPLDFPQPYDVKDPYEAMEISLSDLKHWENAPFNPLWMEQAGVDFVLTKDTLKNAEVFWKKFQQALLAGLSAQDALEALTVRPAALVNAPQLGTLKPGQWANFFISSESLGNPDFTLTEHWVKGQQAYNGHFETLDIRGNYDVVLGGHALKLKVSGKRPKPHVEATDLHGKHKATLKRQGELLSIALNLGDSLHPQFYLLSGKISLKGAAWDGNAKNPEGQWVPWTAIKTREPLEPEKQTRPDSLEPGPVWFPDMAYGFDTLPTSKTFVITNTTLWTCADTGTLERVDLWVENGKIKRIGQDILIPENIPRINGSGKHVTPGLVDEHSHIAISRGVNESGQAVTSEVRIGDVINPEDINIYRQLAGGVTTAQLLHGSANPIGGQSAIVKLRWGSNAEEMKVKDAGGFIKFALGENVKRGNSRNHGNRFPITRMGVEQTFADAFIRAKEYQHGNGPVLTPASRRKKEGPGNEAARQRKDLELEALVEILEDERDITCHSYVQSEMNMLMHLADSLGFRIRTFTHALEGYKVADKMQARGIGGSTFSDWWAYKFEVKDAIPYNAAIMHNQGVTVAINSDDAEMGRRLNQEAAKVVKYGGVSEEESLKMITVNPAKLLGLDHRIGSIEVGKDADLVIWSDHPLGTHAIAEKTFIEGRLYYDRSRDKLLQERVQQERGRIFTKMLQEAKDRQKQKLKKKQETPHYHCDTILEEYMP